MLSRVGLMQGRLSSPVGRQIQSFPKKSWESEFEKAKKLSIKFIEWTLDHKNLSSNPLLQLSGQKKIKNLCRKNNIKIYSITGDCFMQKPFWKYNGIYRKKLIVELKKIISGASKLKIKFLIIPLVDNGNLENFSQKKIVIQEFNRIKNFLKKKKVKILFETELNPNENFEFFKNFDKKYFGLNYDTGNSASLNFDPCQEFKKNGSIIKNIHIKDRKKFGGTVPLGKGSAKFNLISRLCKKYNYRGNYILQAARERTGEEFKTIETYLKFLKKNFL